MFGPSVLTDGRQSETALMVQRGTGRLLRALGLAMLTEMPLASGRRADIVALTGAGEVWIVEIKSSVQDLRGDGKWPDYRLHCDRLFFAAPPDLDIGLFPADTGFICADGYGAEILRAAPEHRMAAATRKAMTIRFARLAAARLHGLADPGLRLGEDLL